MKISILSLVSIIVLSVNAFAEVSPECREAINFAIQASSVEGAASAKLKDASDVVDKAGGNVYASKEVKIKEFMARAEYSVAYKNINEKSMHAFEVCK